jgi:hypothetical protein
LNPNPFALKLRPSSLEAEVEPDKSPSKVSSVSVPVNLNGEKTIILPTQVVTCTDDDIEYLRWWVGSESSRYITSRGWRWSIRRFIEGTWGMMEHPEYVDMELDVEMLFAHVIVIRS